MASRWFCFVLSGYFKRSDIIYSIMEGDFETNCCINSHDFRRNHAKVFLWSTCGNHANLYNNKWSNLRTSTFIIQLTKYLGTFTGLKWYEFRDNYLNNRRHSVVGRGQIVIERDKAFKWIPEDNDFQFQSYIKMTWALA